MLNKICLIGNLGKDPEIRYTQNQKAVATFSVATTEKYKNSQGEMVQETEWHNCVIWGKGAEIVEKYLKKGSKVYIEGKSKTRSWDDKDGNKRYITEVIVSEFKFLDSKPQSEGERATNYEPTDGNDNGEDNLPF